ncbi:MAG TPA: hypothetical protein VMT10_05975 [Solirubrobacteraceae bacterium]|nr:hypothetical protein [Solirubrobacteraceae bacterium]
MRQATAVRALGESLISLASVLGTTIADPDGRVIGRLADVVVRWDAEVDHPPVTAVIVRTGGLRVVIDAGAVAFERPARLTLRSAAADVRAVKRHPGDVALAHDVLDHQLVDVNGVKLARPSDVHLAVVDGRIVLTGIEIGIGALLRRLGPARLRRRARPASAIDWAVIRGFSPARPVHGPPLGGPAAIAGQVGAELRLGAIAGEVPRLRPDEIQAALDRQHGGGDTSS